jgi:hypothetical protein
MECVENAEGGKSADHLGLSELGKTSDVCGRRGAEWLNDRTDAFKPVLSVSSVWCVVIIV